MCINRGLVSNVLLWFIFRDNLEAEGRMNTLSRTRVPFQLAVPDFEQKQDWLPDEISALKMTGPLGVPAWPEGPMQTSHLLGTTQVKRNPTAESDD